MSITRLHGIQAPVRTILNGQAIFTNYIQDCTLTPNANFTGSIVVSTVLSFYPRQ